ncbi:MAG: glycosyltransferase family 4 protein [Verrucomicrobiaceae bacterium]|nr:glycosyltransferase family 4 protein [Verrucomicrobiaceae bacterium]
MKLLIIDPDISLVSPSMKGVIRSFPEIRQAGFEIEVWCWRCDDGVDPHHVVRLPVLGARLLGPLQAIVFSILVTLRAFWVFQILGRPQPDVTFSLVPYLSRCDVAHAQFSPWDWENRMSAMGSRTPKEWLERAANLIIRCWTNWFVCTTRARSIIVPSDAVAEDFRRATDRASIEVLPNSYDPARFNLETRERWRAPQRRALGYGDDDRVFIFVSTGHYRRKGFFLAVKAIEKLRLNHPHARLLVVGGVPRTLDRLKQRLGVDHPGWEEWLHFTGSTNTPEQFMAAADAFLFPSWSEALALVEIEAAACGLPLFLTHHHGSEMVLENGVNGSLIDFDPDHMAKTLDRFLTGEWKPQQATLKRALDRDTYAAALVNVLRSAASRTRMSAQPPSASHSVGIPLGVPPLGGHATKSPDAPSLKRIHS